MIYGIHCIFQLWYSVSDLVKAWDLIIAVVKNSSQHEQELSSRNPSQSLSLKIYKEEAATLNPASPELIPTVLDMQHMNELEGHPDEANMIQYRKRREGERRRERRSAAFVIAGTRDQGERAHVGGDGMERQTQERNGRDMNGVTENGEGKWEEKRGREGIVNGVKETEHMRRKPAKAPSGGKPVTEQDTFKHDLVDVTRQILQVNFSCSNHHLFAHTNTPTYPVHISCLSNFSCSDLLYP